MCIFPIPTSALLNAWHYTIQPTTIQPTTTNLRGQIGPYSFNSEYDQQEAPSYSNLPVIYGYTIFLPSSKKSKLGPQ